VWILVAIFDFVHFVQLVIGLDLVLRFVRNELIGRWAHSIF
tara:strand:- start:455 stop:577 length:123 start_codon:yes stop_codon:yes gene_type:complete